MAQNGDRPYEFGLNSTGDSISKFPTTINPDETSTQPKKRKNAKIQVDLQEKKNYRTIVTQTVWPRREFEQNSQGHQQPTTTITTRPSTDDSLNESGGFSKDQQKQRVDHGKSYTPDGSRSPKVDRTRLSNSQEHARADDVANVSKQSQIFQNPSQYASTGGSRYSEAQTGGRGRPRSRSPSPQPPISRGRDRLPEEPTDRQGIRKDAEHGSSYQRESSHSGQQTQYDNRKDRAGTHRSPDAQTGGRGRPRSRSPSPQPPISRGRDRSPEEPTDRQVIRKDNEHGSSYQRESSHSGRQNQFDNRKDRAGTRRSPETRHSGHDHQRSRSSSPNKAQSHSFTLLSSKQSIRDDDRRKDDHRSAGRQDSPHSNRQEFREQRKDQSTSHHSPDRKTDRRETYGQRSSSPEKQIIENRERSKSKSLAQSSSSHSARQDQYDDRKERSSSHHSPNRQADRRDTNYQRSPSPKKSTISSPRRERSKSKTTDPQESRRDTDKLSTAPHRSSSPGRQDSYEDRKRRSNSRRSPGGRRYTRENRRSPSSPDRKDSRSNDRRSPRRRESSPSNERNNRSTSRGKMIDASTQRSRSNTGYSPVIRPTGSRSDSSDRRRHGSRYDHRQETTSSSEEAAGQSSSKERTRSSSQRKPSSRRTTQGTSPKREEFSSSRNTKTKERSDLHTNQGRQSSVEKGSSDNNTDKRRRPSITPLPARKPNENERSGRKDSGTASIRSLRPSPTPPQQETPRRPTPTLPLSKEPYAPIIPRDDPPTRDNSTARPPAQVNAVANVDGLTIQLNIGIQTDPKLVGAYDTTGRVNDRIMHESSHSNSIRDHSQSEYHPNRSPLTTHHENAYETIEQVRNHSTTTDRPPSHMKQYNLRPSVVTDSRTDRSRYSSRVEEQVPIHSIESTSVQPEPQRREQRPTSTSVSRQSNQFHDLAEQDQIGSDEMIRTTSSIPSRTGSRLDGPSSSKQDQHIPPDRADDYQTPSRKQDKVHHATENRISPSVNTDFVVPFDDYGPPRSNRNFQPVNRDGSPNSKTLLLPVLNSSRTYVVERTRAQPTSPLRQSRSNGNFYLGNRTPNVQQEPAVEDANE